MLFPGLLESQRAAAGAPVERVMPVFNSAGAGAEAATSATNLTPAVPGSNGHYLLMLVQVRDGNVGAGSIDNLAALNSAGWATIHNRTQNGAAVVWMLGKLHDGSEAAPTIQWTGANAAFARIYAYENVDPVDPIDVIGTPTGASLITTVSMPSLTTIDDNCLAVALIAAAQDVTAVAAATGETGGNWLKTVTDFVGLSGADSTLVAMHALMATAGTISGGTTTLSQSTSWTCLPVALKGALAGSP